MIGHCLLTLTPKEEARLLTMPFGPHEGGDNFGGGAPGCLLMVAYGLGGGRTAASEALGYFERGGDGPALRYDYLCDRFGIPRVNAAIRNRILANQARRALVQPREAVSA